MGHSTWADNGCGEDHELNLEVLQSDDECDRHTTCYTMRGNRDETSSSSIDRYGLTREWGGGRQGFGACNPLSSKKVVWGPIDMDSAPVLSPSPVLTWQAGTSSFERRTLGLGHKNAREARSLVGWVGWSCICDFSDLSVGSSPSLGFVPEIGSTTSP